MTRGGRLVDWVTSTFPGDGLENPSDAERDRADILLRQRVEGAGPVPRTYPDMFDEGFASFYAGLPTNRAFVRNYLRQRINPGREATR